MGHVAIGRTTRRQRRRDGPGGGRRRPRAHLSNAAALVDELTHRGVLDNGRLTSAGREMTAAIQTTVATATAPIWESLPDEDVAAATRVLNEIVTRARAVLATSPLTRVKVKNV